MNSCVFQAHPSLFIVYNACQFEEQFEWKGSVIYMQITPLIRFFSRDGDRGRWMGRGGG